ncbi:hypothetical protein D7241_10160 [Stutzerimonas sp. VN223-3]|uniref:hypothetical protein n=1 Tax=Stutzerimonas sp. VN223-3 TaxID=3384601 RepID=UPI0038B5C01A
MMTQKFEGLRGWLALLVRFMLVLVLSFACLVFLAALGANIYLWFLGKGFYFDWGLQLYRALEIGVKIGGALAILMWLGARIPKP